MVYNTQNYWVLGFCPSPNILKAREHNVSKTGFVSETLYSLVFEYRTMDKVKKPSNSEFACKHPYRISKKYDL
jgi:hypothetical protein